MKLKLKLKIKLKIKATTVFQQLPTTNTIERWQYLATRTNARRSASYLTTKTEQSKAQAA